MKNVHIGLLLMLFSPAILCAQTTWYVPDDYSTIQGAISDVSVVNGDTVIVRPGTYAENLDMQGKAITVAGEMGAGTTIIDGGQTSNVIRCYKNEDENTVIQGFTITNGIGIAMGHVGYLGGGIYNQNSSPTVEDCVFTGNHADRGGAMYNTLSSPTILRCVFIENSAFLGGAIFNSDFCNPILTHCSFIRNTANLHCGGLYNQFNCNPELNSCVFIGNSAQTSTGALYNSYSCATQAANCTFYGNSAASSGAVSDNISTTPAVFANCIFWDNHPDQITTYNAQPLITYCCVQGGWSGAGNIDLDPLFVDSLNEDVHLSYPSPCRGAGHNSAAFPAEDFDGNPRIAYGTVDMGADEFYTHLYVTGNKTPGGAVQGKFVGLPGTDPVDLLIGSGILPSPMNTVWGDFWLQSPWFLFGPLGSIPADGIKILRATLPAGMTVPVDIPMQALIGLNPDSLTNLYVLEVR